MARQLKTLGKPRSIVAQLKEGVEVARTGTLEEKPKTTKVKKVVKKVEKETSYQLLLPKDLLIQLKVSASEKETSIRAIILESLKKNGYKVGAIEDRRRV
jgi:hypothetical protein